MDGVKEKVEREREREKLARDKHSCTSDHEHFSSLEEGRDLNMHRLGKIYFILVNHQVSLMFAISDSWASLELFYFPISPSLPLNIM